jgi:hypothetical protein
MSGASVLCCYRDCRRVVWATRDGALDVVASSGTCIDCRRVALCLEHLERVREARGGLACPGCGGRRWQVVVFEPVSVRLERRREIEQAGGRVEVRFVSTGVEQPAVAPTYTRPINPVPTPFPARPASPPPAQVPPRPVLPPGLVLVRRIEGAQVISSEVSVVAETEVHLPGRVVHAAEPVRAVAVHEGAVVVESAAGLEWYDAEGRALHLANPHGLGNRAPVFLDAACVAFLAEVPDGRRELWVAHRIDERRVESRRVGTASAYVVDGAPGPVAIDGGASIVLPREDAGRRAQPVAVVVATGAVEILDEAGVRALAGARHGPWAAWITGAGEVRRGGPGRRPVTLGRSTGTSLALSPDGHAVAWCEGRDLWIATGGEAPVRTAAPGDLALLDWR